MGYFKAGKQQKEGSEFMEFNLKEKVEDILKYPFAASEVRGIRKDTCEKFGVRAGLSESDGETVEAYYFPSYNQKGKVVGFSKQDVTKSKEEKGHWTTVGSVNIGNKLFGQDVAESVNRSHSNLVITEGQWDAISVYQAQVDQVKGTKYEGMQPFVVSIPLGTANAVEAILHNEKFCTSYTDLTIFFDDDYCTPAETKKGIMKGHEAREAVASALVGSGLSLMTISPTDGFKDASDYLQADKSSELAKLVQFGKRVYCSEKIASAASITFEELITKREEGVKIKSFPELMEKIRGFRKRELVLLTSGSGCGKSTVCSIFGADFIEAGYKVGLIYLEETKVETMQRMVSHKLKVNYNKFKNEPLSVATEADIRAAYDSIVDQDMAVFLDHFGNLPVSELMGKIKQMHLVSGCDFIILDHITLVASGGGRGEDERKVLDQTMTELAAFCASNDVGIIAVSHINRGGFADNKPPKDADEEPYWIKVDKSHMRGSAALEQLSWTILGLENQIMPDRSRGNVRLTVLKNRAFGSLGVCDEFKLNEDTWNVELAQPEFNDF